MRFPLQNCSKVSIAGINGKVEEYYSVFQNTATLSNNARGESRKRLDLCLLRTNEISSDKGKTALLYASDFPGFFRDFDKSSYRCLKGPLRGVITRCLDNDGRVPYRPTSMRGVFSTPAFLL